MGSIARNLAVVIGANILGLFVACGTMLTPAEQVEIAETAATLLDCQELGRACKADGGEASECYAAYDECVRDAGLR